MKNLLAASVVLLLVSPGVLAADVPAAITPSTVTVTFSGPAPVMKKTTRQADAFCGKTPMKDQQVLVRNGKLQNVMIRVIKGANGSYPLPAEPLLVSQQNCEYLPRVAGLREGQDVTIKSDDDTTHNVHLSSGERTLFNRVQTMGAFTKKSTELKAKDRETLSLMCDIHPWMAGFLLVTTNPYFGVTDEKGQTKLDLPPGKYTVEAWHERYGVKTLEITVESGKPSALTFDYTGTEKSVL